MVQVSTYDQAGKPSRDVLSSELTTLSSSLRAVHRTASASLPSALQPPAPNNDTSTPSLPPIPETLIEYVEAGRNPDVYTREFVELVRRMNQLARGKEAAFARFRDVLAAETARAMPELAADVDRVVEATGGRVPIPPVVPVAGAAEGPTREGGEEQGAGGGGGQEGEKK